MLTGMKGIIFDLDGTMIDSMWMWRDIDLAFMGERNLPFTDDLERAIEGMSFRETAQYFIQTYQLKETAEELMQIWIEMAIHKYQYEVLPKPGLLAFLQEMKRRGIRMGIATSNARTLLDAAANAHGLYDYMDAVLTANEVARGKPAPDVFLAVSEKIGIPPAQCLVFEDIVQGIRAGLAAGMKVCAISDDYSVAQDEEKRALAHYYIDSYTQVLDGSFEHLRT
ncbi:MAG: HAD family phosphatase [Eubacterium sp.]|nr:HAD family phosphatase [Eubacterium sp.]